MKITSKGQVTIPQDLRKQFGLLPDTHVTFVADGNGLRLVKATERSGRGWKIVESLRGCAKGKWTTEEIMKLTRGE